MTARGYHGKFVSEGEFHLDLTPAPGHEVLTQPGRPDGLGTALDPIDVRGDLRRAITLMSTGRHVRLNSTTEVGPLMKLIHEEAAKLQTPPRWDLGLISVLGTGLFTEQNVGVPRSRMPQLNGVAPAGTEAALLAHGAGRFVELDPQFRARLKADGHRVINELVPTHHLRAAQTNLTAETVAGIADAFTSGSQRVEHMLAEPLWVTDDGYVLDGQHRWAARTALALGGSPVCASTETHRISLPARAAIPYADTFAESMGIMPRDLGNSKIVEG